LLAARANQPEVMQALIAGGADPRLKAQDGSTLLMAAAGSGHLAVVQYAYQFDQDVKAVNTTGATVLHAAVSFTASRATQQQICEVIEFLAGKGAPLDEKDRRGRTPLEIADVLPIDKAVELLTHLIEASGAKPKTPSAR